MLISVFGIWLMASNIAYLKPYSPGCVIQFAGGSKYISEPCSVVAAEINRQLESK